MYAKPYQEYFIMETFVHNGTTTEKRNIIQTPISSGSWQANATNTRNKTKKKEKRKTKEKEKENNSNNNNISGKQTEITEYKILLNKGSNESIAQFVQFI